MMTAFSAGGSGRMAKMQLIHTVTFIVAITVAEAMASGNRLYSEGGLFLGQNGQPQQSTTADGYGGGGGTQSAEYFDDTEYPDPNLYRTQSLPEQGHQRERLAKILEQLQQANRYSGGGGIDDDVAEVADADELVLNSQEPRERNRNAQEMEELRRLSDAIYTKQQQQQQQQFNDGSNTGAPMGKQQYNGAEDQKLAAVKKGQSEFVEFVEPHQSQRQKASEYMEKRVPANMAYGDDQEESNYEGPFKFFANTGNVLYVAYLAICCVGIIAGVVGGMYYYKHVRAARVDDPFNEFTRYSPSGPSKDKLKKSAKAAAGAQGFSQTGDDALAYKAQLQHYQQQKQKILGMPAGGTSGNDTLSDNEEDTDELEHNFSVFECPGLAPTGDVEIQNPNFVGDENNGKTDVPLKDQHTD